MLTIKNKHELEWSRLTEYTIEIDGIHHKFRHFDSSWEEAAYWFDDEYYTDVEDSPIEGWTIADILSWL